MWPQYRCNLDVPGLSEMLVIWHSKVKVVTGESFVMKL